MSAEGVEVAIEEVVAVVEAQAEPIGVPLIETVTTVEQFAGLVSRLTAEKSPLWFRGTRKASYDLEPSLYRHPTIKDADELIDLEWELLSEFRNRSPPFTNKLPTESLELLFLMQHVGVPTRLLDWTENPMISLFFALENARAEAAGHETDACVWVLDPLALNMVSLNHRENSGRVFGAYSDELGGYKPNSTSKMVSMLKPVAIYGVHNSPRIVAQRGTFLLFGKNTTPANKQTELLATAGLLRRIIIPAANKKDMFAALFSMGVSDSVVYPDLDGLGREIRNRRGF